MPRCDPDDDAPVGVVGPLRFGQAILFHPCPVELVIVIDQTGISQSVVDRLAVVMQVGGVTEATVTRRPAEADIHIDMSNQLLREPLIAYIRASGQA